jgi:Mg-chelatase subunit ChlD
MHRIPAFRGVRPAGGHGLEDNDLMDSSLLSRRRAALAVLASAVLTCAGSAAAEPSGQAARALTESDLAEEVLVRRVNFPVRLIPRRPGGCDALGPADVQVLENGIERPVDAIERTRLDTIHAVLIDASYSMRDRLDRAKRAAADYIAALPDGEAVALASFRDNLMLHVPPTTDRERLARELEGIEVGSYTAFNDALHSMVRYLAPRPERKVIVALTDGCDSASLHVHPFRQVVRMAESAESLTVFPIGIDLPRRCDGFLVNVGAGGGPVDLLEQLGRRSGGELFRIEQAAALPEIFTEIRSRLDQEGHVVYRPLAAEGARAARGRDASKVKIRVRSTTPACRVRPAASTVRYLDGVVPDPEPRPVSPLLASDPGELPFHERLELPYDSQWTRRIEEQPTWLQLGERTVTGRVADLEIERGALYASHGYHVAGKYRFLPDLFERYHVRDLELPVPSIDEVRASIDSPEALLGYLVEREAPPFDRPSDPRGKQVRLGGSWVHGQAFLELREVLGRVFYRYPGYREWADGRLRAERRAELAALVEEYAERHGLPAGDAEALVDLLEASRSAPKPEGLQRHLAEWLGDVTALELVAAVERRISDALLRDERGVLQGESGPVDTARAVWEQPDRWFPPPTHLRVVTPMVPAYDPERDVVGFYRLVLPTVAEAGPPVDRVPAAPLGVGLARWLVDATRPEELDTGALRVEALRYGVVDRRERRRVRRVLEEPKPSLRDLRAVTLVLRESGEEGATLELTGYYLDPRRGVESDGSVSPPPSWSRERVLEARAPLCVNAVRDTGGAVHPKLDALMLAALRASPVCPSTDTSLWRSGDPAH